MFGQAEKGTNCFDNKAGNSLFRKCKGPRKKRIFQNLKKATTLQANLHHRFTGGSPQNRRSEDFSPVSYAIYSPSWHIKNGLLTQDLVDDIRQNNKRILSVGSGPAYLERLLVNHLGIKNEQINLSDNNMDVMPEGFKKFKFDMNKKWPDFERPFDYIIFPQSIIMTHFKDDTEAVNDLSEILRKSLKIIKPNGHVRMDEYLMSEVNSRINVDFVLDTVRAELKRDYKLSDINYDSNLIVTKKNLHV